MRRRDLKLNLSLRQLQLLKPALKKRFLAVQLAIKLLAGTFISGLL